MSAAGTQPSVDALVNAQGSHFDPIEIKKSSAAKMRLADKTGNAQLRKEAAAEQSFADRLGGRTALLSDQIKLQIQQKQTDDASATEETVTEPVTPTESAKSVEVNEVPAQSTSQSIETQTDAQPKKTRKRNNKQQPETVSDDAEVIRQRQPLRPQSQPFTPQQAPSQRPQPLVRNASVPANKTQPTQQPAKAALPLMRNASLPAIPSWLSVTLPPEAIALKLDAATKQSLADKTGDLSLKRAAALEQSLADKMAFICTPGATTTALHAGRKGLQLPQSSPQPSVPAQPEQKAPQRKGELAFLSQLLQTQNPQPKPEVQIQDRAQIKELVAKQRIPQPRQPRTLLGPKPSSPPSRSDSTSWRQRETEPQQPKSVTFQTPAKAESPKTSPRQSNAIPKEEKKVETTPQLHPLTPATACM